MGSLLVVSFPAFGEMGGISGKLVYSKHGTIGVHTLGGEDYMEIGEGDFARWGPNGQRVAVKHDSTVHVVNADGSGEVVLAGTRYPDLWVAPE
jgi:hypothetical protein